MKTLKRLAVTAGLAGWVCLSAGQALAQGGGGMPGGGNFDPAKFQQQMQKMLLDNYRNQLTITNDAEWSVIQEKIQKVLDARQETGFGGMGGMLGMFGRGPRPGGPDAAAPGAGGAGRRGLAAFGGAPSPEEDALQKALDAGASNPELKAALAKVVEARKAKQAKLEKAQDELRQVLSVRQEAMVSLGGLL